MSLVDIIIQITFYTFRAQVCGIRILLVQLMLNADSGPVSKQVAAAVLWNSFLVQMTLKFTLLVMT